jgi:catechol 2,3-dioxygenase-like lactoylglutathione lyase family enzyme
MRKQIFVAGFVVSLFLQSSAFAQLSAANDSGISMGHIHLYVRDAAQHKKLWVEALGAEVTKAGTLEMLRIPGVYIILTQREPTAGSEGSTVNHIGIQVRDMAATRQKLAASGIEIPSGIPIATFPDGIRVEFLEEKTMATPSAMHHIHMSVTDGEALRQWYVKTFGAAAGSRRNLPAAMFNGNEVDFLPAKMPTEPTKGRAIDHIGFEVKNLAEFVKKLQAAGVAFDGEFREVPQLGLKIAFILDPVGTRIELTEGLAGR